jgi:hypothetical protein
VTDHDIGDILNDLPEATFNDTEAERQFRLVEEIVVEEMNARLAMGDTTDTQQGVKKIAHLITDGILWRFELKERTSDHPLYRSDSRNRDHKKKGSGK